MHDLILLGKVEVNILLLISGTHLPFGMRGKKKFLREGLISSSGAQSARKRKEGGGNNERP